MVIIAIPSSLLWDLRGQEQMRIYRPRFPIPRVLVGAYASSRPVTGVAKSVIQLLKSDVIA